HPGDVTGVVARTHRQPLSGPRGMKMHVLGCVNTWTAPLLCRGDRSFGSLQSGLSGGDESVKSSGNTLTRLFGSIRSRKRGGVSPMEIENIVARHRADAPFVAKQHNLHFCTPLSVRVSPGSTAAKHDWMPAALATIPIAIRATDCNDV